MWDLFGKGQYSIRIQLFGESCGNAARGERQVLPLFRHCSLTSASVRAPLTISFFD
jgi:hypothetical protein